MAATPPPQRRWRGDAVPRGILGPFLGGSDVNFWGERYGGTLTSADTGFKEVCNVLIGLLWGGGLFVSIAP